MHIGLIPLDERPVNTRYPQMIAAIAGETVTLPPPEALGHIRTPANRTALHDWLLAHAAGFDTLIVSFEMLGYGGLIASRTTDETALTITQSLDVLRRLENTTRCGFNVITRISNADDSFEEPSYWSEHGRDLYRYSQLMHRQQAGQDVAAELNALRDRLPAEHLADFIQRRLRNHRVNLAALNLLADGVLDLLVLSSDDTSEYGFGSQEKAWLHTWADRLHLGDDRLLMYPGADEVGCVLLARALLAGEQPRFAVHYAIDADREIVAPYEDSPVRVTVERQVRALGGTLIDSSDDADLIVAVNTPSRIRQEYDENAEGFDAEHRRRAPQVTAFVQQVAAWVEAGRSVIVCDVAYPNGADPLLIEALFGEVDLSQLAAYGAWNTAGNTIGTALAQGVAARRAETDAQREAQQRFLLHRFLEDWGYQHRVRAQVREWLRAATGHHDPAPERVEAARQKIEEGLTDALAEIPGFDGWRLVPGSVRLPWARTFEVDFDLERV